MVKGYSDTTKLIDELLDWTIKDCKFSVVDVKINKTGKVVVTSHRYRV